MSFSGRHGEEGGRELSAEAGPTWSGWRGSCHPWRRRQGCRAIAAVTMSLSPQPIGEICPGPQLSCSALRPRLGSSQVACGWAVCGWRVGPGRRPQQRSAASVQRLSFLFCFGFEIRIPVLVRASNGTLVRFFCVLRGSCFPSPPKLHIISITKYYFFYVFFKIYGLFNSLTNT